MRKTAGVRRVQCPEWRVKSMQTLQSSRIFPMNQKKRKGRGPGTGQPILVPDDVAPLPVNGGYGRYFAREMRALAVAEGCRPGSLMVWGNKKVLSEMFLDGITYLLQEALAKDEDAFDDGECPASVRRFINSMRRSRKLCREDGCTAPGCSCCTTQYWLLVGFLEDIMMDLE